MNTDDRSGRPYEQNRFFLKDLIRQQIDFSRTQQGRHEPAPPLQKPSPPGAARIRLPDGAAALARSGRMPLGEAIARRESVRDYLAAPFTLEVQSGGHGLCLELPLSEQIMRHPPFPAIPEPPEPGAGREEDSYSLKREDEAHSRTWSSWTFWNRLTKM